MKINVSTLVIGFYAWVTAVFFGGNMLDVVYYRTLHERLSDSLINAVYSAISDLLLWIGAVMILAAIGAVAISWNSSRTRNLLIASTLLGIFTLFTPVLLAPLVQDSMIQDFGPWLRLILCGSISALAFAGLLDYGGYKIGGS